MAEGSGPGSFKEFDARLEKLRRPQGAGPKPEPAEGQRLNFGSGLQVGIEILAGVGGGLLLGYGLDRWLGTQPLFLIGFFVLGAAAGMLNAFRHLRRLQASQD